MTSVVVVASHRRSGTHLVLDSLRQNAVGVNPRFMTLERIDPGHEHHLTVAQFDRRLRQRDGTVLVKTHTLPDATAWRDREAGEYAASLLSEAPTVYVHRDGRDVLVSLYHFIASYSPRVSGQPFGAFIRDPHTGGDAPGLNRAAYWQRHVLAWLDSGPTAIVGYAEVLASFPTAMAALGDRLDLRLLPDVQPVGLEPPASAFAMLVRRFRRLIGRAQPRVSTAIRPRSGGSGGWQAAFNEDDLAWFRQEASEAMGRLGYV